MASVDCQSSSFLFDDSTHCLPKISSTTDLYDYFTNNMAFKTLLSHIDDDHNDDDRLIATSPTTMTSSDSSDSAIVSDELDEFDSPNERTLQSHNVCARTIEKKNTSISTTFSSLSQSFDILNHIEKQTITEHTSTSNDSNNREKYTRPLPWSNSTAMHQNYSSTPSLDLTSNKVFFIFRFLSVVRKGF